MKIILNGSSGDLTLKRNSEEINCFSSIKKNKDDIEYITENFKPKIRIIHVGGTEITYTLQKDNHYVFEEVSSLAITLGAVTDNKINIFSFEFDSGSVPTVLTLPSGMGYIGGAPTIEANAHYYFEIEKSYDGRYFCKYEKYTGGGSYIYPSGYTILSWDSSSITMSGNINVQDVIDHLLIVTSYGNVTAIDDPTYTIKLVLNNSIVGIASVAGNIISYQYDGPPISDIQWV